MQKIEVGFVDPAHLDELYALIQSYMDMNDMKGYVEGYTNSHYWKNGKEGEPYRDKVEKMTEILNTAVFPAQPKFGTYTIIPLDSNRGKCDSYHCYNKNHESNKLTKGCYALAVINDTWWRRFCPECSRKEIESFRDPQMKAAYLKAYNSFVSPTFTENACVKCPKAAKCITSSIGA